MSVEASGTYARPLLSDTEAAVYFWTVRHGRVDPPQAAAALNIAPEEVERIVGVLGKCHLLRPAPGAAGDIVAVSPEAAGAELLAPVAAQVRELQEYIGKARTQLLSMMPTYSQLRRARSSDEAVEVLADSESVRCMLADIAAQCRTEVFSAHPGIGGAKAMEQALTVNRPLLERGVRMRTIYQHTTRVSAAMQSFAGQLIEAGCEIRTLDEVTDRLIIFDREIAFLPHGVADGTTPGAVVIRQVAIVDFLYRSLEQSWGRALPFVGADTESVATGYGIAGDELKRSVVRLLAEGAKDELIARRLGMSLRTCRRHIAEVMGGLNATSRFQAGVLATRMQLLADEVEVRADDS